MAELKNSSIILLIVAGIGFFIAITYVLSWDCTRNTDCGQDLICDVNHQCTPIAKTLTIYESTSYILPAIIIGIAIIIATVIYKRYSI